MKGYDSLWGLVQSLFLFDGIDGSTSVVDQKTNALAYVSNCVVSRSSDDFPDGALWFADMSSPRYVLAGSSGHLTLGLHVFSCPFVLTDWGPGGMLRIFRANSMSCYIDPTIKRLYWATNIDDAGWVNATYDIPDPASFLSVRHDMRLYITSSEQYIELDDVEVARVAHGKTGSSMSGQQIRFGQAVASGDGWIGLIGPFRWTTGDLRISEAGSQIDRYEQLSALDSARETVVFHSHFEPSDDGNVVDTRGNLVTLYGNARLSTTKRRFGLSSFQPRSGGAMLSIAAIGAADFELEAWAIMSTTSPNFAWVFCCFDGLGNIALGLKHRWSEPSGSEIILIVAGTTYTVPTALGYGSDGYFSVCRRGDSLALFSSGQRLIFADVSGVHINNTGAVYIGRPPQITDATPETLYLDEMRLGVGVARHNPLLTTITAPTERFNDYGPSYCGGTTENPDGTVRPNTLVRVYHRRTGRLVSEGYSDQDGAYTLPTADTSQHVVAHLHDDDDVNAVVYDHVYPVLIS
jgi:hypothetical protein